MLGRSKHNRFSVKAAISSSLVLLTLGTPTFAQAGKGSPAMASEQEMLKLSKQKWDWMAERNVDALTTLFDDQCMFVHMGATMNKTQELDVIKGGMIQYKKADIEEQSVKFFGTTAIVFTKMKLLAVVGGNEVTNPFMVTEVYVEENGAHKLASLSFTRLITPGEAH
jgi:hypothetical protein